MTLIELTVIILVLLTLIGVLFVGANAWKKGADRTSCIMNQYDVQRALRSYANVNEFEFGDDLSTHSPPVDLRGALVTSEFLRFYPSCPGDGIYSFGGDKVPSLGQLYMTCSLARAGGHLPKETRAW